MLIITVKCESQQSRRHAGLTPNQVSFVEHSQQATLRVYGVEGETRPITVGGRVDLSGLPSGTFEVGRTYSLAIGGQELFDSSRSSTAEDPTGPQAEHDALGPSTGDNDEDDKGEPSTDENEEDDDH